MSSIVKTDVSETSQNVVNISPNPVTGNVIQIHFNLKLKSRIAACIYKLDCQPVTQTISVNKEAGISQQNIPLPQSISNGVYMCILVINGESKAIQFIVHK